MSDTTRKMPAVTDTDAKRNYERRLAWLYQKKAINHGWLSDQDAAELRELEAKAKKVQS